MLLAFIILLSSSLVLLTLGQILTVNLVIKDEAYISCDFLFLKLFLYPFKKSEMLFQKRREKRDKKLDIGKKFNKGKGHILLISEIIKRSDVDLGALTLPINEDDPAVYVLKSPKFYAFISSLLVVLKSNARSFICRNPDFVNKDGQSVSLDIAFKMSLFDLARSLLSYKFRKRKMF
jgi:hypothetical protein